MTRRPHRAVLAALLPALLPAAVLPGTPIPAVAVSTPTPTVVTLVGSLQSELGCTGDWQPACSATALPRVGDTTQYAATFKVPKGSYAIKVALNGGWDETYGLAGRSENIPLVLAGPATKADKALARHSLRESLTREQMYFVMADRFANDSTSNDAGVDRWPPRDRPRPHRQGLLPRGRSARADEQARLHQGPGHHGHLAHSAFKNQPVQRSGTNASAGYHGYWVTDFTQVDPHLGTNADMRTLVPISALREDDRQADAQRHLGELRGLDGESAGQPDPRVSPLIVEPTGVRTRTRPETDPR